MSPRPLALVALAAVVLDQRRRLRQVDAAVSHLLDLHPVGVACTHACDDHGDGWHYIERPDGNLAVVPCLDDVGHELYGDACPCGPDELEHEEGHVVIEHHALDGRS